MGLCTLGALGSRFLICIDHEPFNFLADPIYGVCHVSQQTKQRHMKARLLTLNSAGQTESQ